MTVESIRTIGVKQQGKSHITYDTPCQDNVSTLSKNEIYTIALADGAGSRNLSHFGSEIVTRMTCEILTNNFYEIVTMLEKKGLSEEDYLANLEETRKKIINTIKKPLEEKASQLESELGDLASTLLFASKHNDLYIVGHIGDGVIGGLYKTLKGYEVKVLSHPENGEKSNITFFLTGNDAVEHFRIKAFKDPLLLGIVLMSDGPETVFYQKNKFVDNTVRLFTNYSGKSQSKYEKQLQKLLSETISQYSDDDLSIAVMNHETGEIKSLDYEYKRELLGPIYSKDQIIKTSFQSVFIKPFIIPKKRDFSDIESVSRYINEI